LGSRARTADRRVSLARVRHLRRLARLLWRHAQPAASPSDPRNRARRIRHSAADRGAAPTDAFEQDGSLKDKAQQTQCKNVVEALAIAARKFMS
jgi:hypothetical protein